MEPVASPATTIPRRVRYAWLAGTAVGLLGFVTFAVVSDGSDTPTGVVSDYFEAILDGDVEAALSLVDEYPTRSASRYIADEAIADDWRVVEIVEVGAGGSSSERVVRVELGGPDGVAKGELQVAQDDDTGWLVSGSLTSVTIAPSPLDYVQVNGYTPEPQAVSAADGHMGELWTVDLLPGLYSFYEDIPGVVSVADSGTFAALSSDVTDTGVDGNMLAPGKVVAEKKTIASAREQLDERLRDCVTATVAQPGNCPFGAGEFVNTADGEHIEDLHDLRWSLERMPRFTLLDARFGNTEDAPNAATDGAWRFRFVTDDTAVLTLRGKGTDSDGKMTDFTVPCRVDMSAVSATVEPTGHVRLSSTGLPNYDDGPLTCGKVL